MREPRIADLRGRRDDAVGQRLDGLAGLGRVVALQRGHRARHAVEPGLAGGGAGGQPGQRAARVGGAHRAGRPGRPRGGRGDLGRELVAAPPQPRRLGKQLQAERDPRARLVVLAEIDRLADRRVVLQFEPRAAQQRAAGIEQTDPLQDVGRAAGQILEQRVAIDRFVERAAEPREHVGALVLDLLAARVERRREQLEPLAHREHALHGRVVEAAERRAPVRVEPLRKEMQYHVAARQHQPFARVAAERVERGLRLDLVGIAVRVAVGEARDGEVELALAVVAVQREAAGRHHGRDQQAGEIRREPLAAAARAQPLDQRADGLQPMLAAKRHRLAERAVLAARQPRHGRRQRAARQRHLGAVALERMMAGQQLEDHAAERVDVVAHRRIGALDHLQARVGRRQRAERAGVEHGLLAGRAGARVAGARDAEVEHLRHAVARDHHVAGLEVGMHDAARVRALQRARHPVDERPRLAQRHPRRTLANQRAQVDAVDVLHRHEDDRAVLVEIVDVDDMVVGQLLRAPRLALQRDQRIRVAPELVVEHLHGQVRIAVARLHLALVAREVDHAHAAAPQLAFEQEAALEQRADRGVVAALRAGDAPPALAAQAVGPRAASPDARERAHHHGGVVVGRCGVRGGPRRGVVHAGPPDLHERQVAVGGRRVRGAVRRGGGRARRAAAGRLRAARGAPCGTACETVGEAALDAGQEPPPAQAARVRKCVGIIHREALREPRAARSRPRGCRAHGARATVRTGGPPAAGVRPAAAGTRRPARHRSVPC